MASLLCLKVFIMSLHPESKLGFLGIPTTRWYSWLCMPIVTEHGVGPKQPTISLRKINIFLKMEYLDIDVLTQKMRMNRFTSCI